MNTIIGGYMLLVAHACVLATPTAQSCVVTDKPQVVYVTIDYNGLTAIYDDNGNSGFVKRESLKELPHPGTPQ